MIFLEGLEKTELNCSWIRSAFFTSMLILFFRAEIPTFSCFLLLMYDHSFLFDLSSEKNVMEVSLMGLSTGPLCFPFNLFVDVPNVGGV